MLIYEMYLISPIMEPITRFQILIYLLMFLQQRARGKAEQELQWGREMDDESYLELRAGGKDWFRRRMGSNHANM